MGRETALDFPIEARLFLHAYKVVIDRVDKELRAISPLSVTEFEVLSHLVRAGGRIRFIDLAHRVKLSQSRVSRQIDSLDLKGYVRREITNQNRRATFAVMTELGQSVYDAAEQPFQQAWRTHFLDPVVEVNLEVFRKTLITLIGDVPMLP